jgi:hypothetical protein
MNIEVPAPVRRSPLCPKAPSEHCAAHPPADRLVRHLDTALGEQIFDLAVAQSESEIHPDGTLDHVGWEAVTGIVRLDRGYRSFARGAPQGRERDKPLRNMLSR